MKKPPVSRISCISELPPFIRRSAWADQAGWNITGSFLVGPQTEPWRTIWSASCRIDTDTGVGSGFFIESDPCYVVTCAHVVDVATQIRVERPLGGGAWFERWAATLVAIDYSHDLAILEVSDVQHSASEDETFPRLPIQTLELAPAPYPGDRVIFCGYPEGVDNPRLAQGLVSGFDVVRIDWGRMRAVVLDAAVNSGNSGGPVCNSDGKVVGLVFARSSPLKCLADEAEKLNGELIAVLNDLNANNGIGYALDPNDVAQLLHSHREFCRRTQRTYRRYSPKIVALDKRDFVGLQLECRERGLSPVGVFSFGDDGQLYHGWHTSTRRTPLEADGWSDCLPRISKSGGSFLLRGYEVLLYRPRYRGYVVPAVLDLC